MKPTRKQLMEEIEQLQIQLAGCGVAAMGYIKGELLVKKGDYGWSAQYQHVVNLRKKFDKERVKRGVL